MFTGKTAPEKCESLFGFHWLGSCRRRLQGGERRAAFLLLFLGAGLMPVQLRAGSPGVFEETGSRVAPSFGDLATLLASGKVLAAGELYDPASGTWAITGNSGTNAPTLLPNGKVLTEGGAYFNGHLTRALPNAALYHPASGTWSATGSMTTARYEHAATLLPNGLTLVTGGLDVFVLPDAEVFNPASETWSPAGRLLTSRAHHSATLLPNGKVLIAGGDTGYGNGVMASSELYDPATGISTTTGSLGVARYRHRAILLADGRVLVVGGLAGSNNNSYPLASAELYDPASGTWTATGSLSSARRSSTATLLPNGKVLVVGGEDGTTTLASAELYDPASGAWYPGEASLPPALLTARGCCPAARCSSRAVMTAATVSRARNSTSDHRRRLLCSTLPHVCVFLPMTECSLVALSLPGLS